MEKTAVAVARSRSRFHVDPLVTAAAAGLSLAFAGAFLWRLLVYGLGIEVKDWRAIGCVGINLVTLVLLWSERRRILAHPPREPGADEASWRTAATDVAMRRRLEHPPSFALAAVFVVIVPWTVWLADYFVEILFVVSVFVLLATLVERRRAVTEGSTDTFEGSQAPPGWWALGALAVGLPLVWLPVVLMSAAAGPAPLGMLAIPILHGAAWWGVGTGWRRRWRVDRCLRAIPLEWHWRQRSGDLGLIAVIVLWLSFLMVWPFSAPEIHDVIGPGCLGDLLWFLWWPVTFGLLGNGVSLRRREVRPPPFETSAASKAVGR
jgi:hypothetical protein